MGSCTCDKCKQMCEIPCWPTPSETKALIEGGYAERLMADYWVTDTQDVYVLCPACPGREGKYAAFARAGCTFKTEDGLCEIHGGLKPIEATINYACRGTGIGRREIMEMWNNPESQAIVEEWAND